MASLNVASELVKAVANKMYPVGSIYISLNTTNPSTFLGGTWKQCGTGRFPVSYDPNNTNFNTMGKTGGNATHTHSTNNHVLTVAELPNHTHGFYGNGIWQTPCVDRSHTTTWGASYSESGDYKINNATDQRCDGAQGLGHNHGNTGSAGTLPPYFVCCMWQRTA